MADGDDDVEEGEIKIKKKKNQFFMKMLIFLVQSSEKR
jgi:hypothetical protein